MHIQGKFYSLHLNMLINFDKSCLSVWQYASRVDLAVGRRTALI